MSIETEFQSTIQNVQNAYNGLNNLGATIPQNKTIENIKSCLDEIYDNLPKTEYQEGTEINLGKTIKGKLDFENGVVGIGQSSQDSTNGYQLWGGFDYTRTFLNITLTFKYNSNGTFVVNGSNTSGSTQNSMQAGNVLQNNYYKTLSAGTYTIQGGTSNIDVQAISITDNSEVAILATSSSGNSANFTLNATTKVYLRAQVATGTSFNNQIVYAMLELGSSAHDWEKYTGGQASPNPSYPQTINSVTGNQDVVVSGKNLFDKNNANVINSYFLQTDPTISASGNSYRSIYIECKPNTTYTISKVSSARFCIGYTTTTPTAGVSVLGAIQNNTATSITITTGENAKYLIAFVYHASYDTSITIQQILDSIMICEGTDTTYEPYITPTSYQLSLGGYEFNGIGNYKDELVYDVDEDKVYKKNVIGEYAFTGEETLNKSGANYAINKYTYTNNLDLPSGTTDYLMNKYNVVASGTLEIGQTRVGTTNLLLNFDGIGTDETTFRNSLASTTLYAPLKTPTLTEIPDTTLINQVKALYNAHSNNGTTIITSNGDLPLVIKVRGLKGE